MTPRAVLLDFTKHRSAASFDNWPAELREQGIAVKGGDSGELPLTVQDYVRQIVEQLDGARVDHIFAYCLSSGIALELARALEDAGQPDVRIVMFDPSRGEPDEIVRAYLDIVAEISAVEHAPPPLAIETDALRRDPAAVLAGVRDDILRRVATAIGLDVTATDCDPLVHAVAGRYLRWFQYFMIVAQAPWTDRPNQTVTQVYSAEHPAVDWPGTAEVIRLGVTKESLLSSAEVHKLVADRLTDEPRLPASPRLMAR